MIDTGCLGQSATNVLGLDFLAQHLVTFDFPERKMYLKTVIGNSVVELSEEQPNNSPEPTPITVSVPHSRLTRQAARLIF